ncbi:hypothetical protein, partial [Escherichia coli]|uniref:hypothetical protein n=1 Tax=Escherichia coli TaxID=562 RepID=UPI00159077A0
LDAQELLWLLQAVMTPVRENTLRSAQASSMLELNALDLVTLINAENAWGSVVEEFVGDRRLWSKRGVLPILTVIISATHSSKNLHDTTTARQPYQLSYP